MRSETMMTFARSLIVAAVTLAAGCSTVRLVTTGPETLERAPVRTVRVEAATLPPPGHQVASLAWQPGAPDPVADAIARGLAERGYQPGGADADLVAVYAVGMRTRAHQPYQQDSTGAMTDQPTTQDGAFAYTERTISLELIDARSGAVLWSGTASETLAPRAAASPTRAIAAVREILARVPAR
jgi:hypothetical protein